MPIASNNTGIMSRRQSFNGKGLTFVEVILNQELGEPFRRDAMKAPEIVAGINKTDMAEQTF